MSEDLKDKGELIRTNMTLDQQTLDCIDKYKDKELLRSRSQAVRNMFIKHDRDNENNGITKEESS